MHQWGEPDLIVKCETFLQVLLPYQLVSLTYLKVMDIFGLTQMKLELNVKKTQV